MDKCEFTIPNPKCLKCRLVPKKAICDIINSNCPKAKCFNCNVYFIMQKFISTNKPANYGEDLDSNKYCFDCYRKLCVDVEAENIIGENDSQEVIKKKRKELKKHYKKFKSIL